MNNIIYILVIASLLIINIITLISLIITKKQNKKMESRIEDRNELANESYINFVTNSRDWAYSYIEEVQDKLKEFAQKVDPHLDYFNTYGKTINSPHTIILEEIDSAYKELKSVLPQENKEK